MLKEGGPLQVGRLIRLCARILLLLIDMKGPNFGKTAIGWRPMRRRRMIIGREQSQEEIYLSVWNA
jgi:hypothetical protein